MNITKYKKQRINAILSFITYINLNDLDDPSLNFISKDLLNLTNAQDFRKSLKDYFKKENGVMANILYANISSSVEFFMNKFRSK